MHKVVVYIINPFHKKLAENDIVCVGEMNCTTIELYMIKYIIQAMGALMILGGALVLINLRKAGGAAIMVVLAFMMLT